MKKRRNLKHISPEEKEKILKMLREGGNALEVGKHFGRSYTVIWKIAKKNNIKLKRENLSEAEKENILNLLKEKI